MHKQDYIIDKTTLHGKCAIYVSQLFNRFGLRGYVTALREDCLGVCTGDPSIWNPNVITFDSPEEAINFIQECKPHFGKDRYSYHIVDCPDEAWVIKILNPITHQYNPDFKLEYLTRLTKGHAEFSTLRRALVMPTHRKALSVLRQYQQHSCFPQETLLLKISKDQYYGLKPIE